MSDAEPPVTEPTVIERTWDGRTARTTTEWPRQGAVVVFDDGNVIRLPDCHTRTEVTDSQPYPILFGVRPPAYTESSLGITVDLRASSPPGETVFLLARPSTRRWRRWAASALVKVLLVGGRS